MAGITTEYAAFQYVSTYFGFSQRGMSHVVTPVTPVTDAANVTNVTDVTTVEPKMGTDEYTGTT